MTSLKTATNVPRNKNVSVLPSMTLLSRGTIYTFSVLMTNMGLADHTATARFIGGGSFVFSVDMLSTMTRISGQLAQEQLSKRVVKDYSKSAVKE